jgi:beta-lactamase class A
VIEAPALPPPAIEQPASHQVSFGLVTGRAAPSTRRVVVSVGARVLADKPLRGRRFSLRVILPTGDVAVRVTTVAAGGRRASSVVDDVFGLPAAARPRVVRARQDAVLARDLRKLVRRYQGTAAVYVQSLTGGAGAAWNAQARFPAASTLKLAIAATVLAAHTGIPPPDSRTHALLREMITRSDNASANALEVWLAGSTSAGSDRVNSFMRSLGLRDSLMYGGYELRTLSGPIPVRVEDQPAFGVGKYTTAWDMSSLLRAIWLAAGGRGPLPSEHPGFTPADGRYLLWLLAHVSDTPKLDRIVGGRRDVAVLHKAGWLNIARHDIGLVFWRGGVFVAGVMTWSARGSGPSADLLAGRVAATALERFRRLRR